MTASAVSTRRADLTVVDLVVTHVAEAMLRWSRERTAHRLPTHEQRAQRLRIQTVVDNIAAQTEYLRGIR